MPPLTHFTADGAAHMVHVGGKPTSERLATAEGRIAMLPATLDLIAQGRAGKGDVLGVARVAGIMAAKKTAELIPLCHPLALTQAEITFAIEPQHNGVRCTATVRTHDRTGVEMEALTAVQVALLTIYDMCKAVDRGMVIQDVRLLEKSGGESGRWRHPAS